MRIARTLAALALAAITALALTTTAQAQVHVIQEDSVACPALSVAPVNEVGDGGDEATGGCPLKMEGEITLYGETIFGHIEDSECAVVFEGIVQENGEGWGQTSSLTDHPDDPVGSCTRDACPEAGHPMEAWPAHIHEISATAPELELEAEFCVVDKNTTSDELTRCEVGIPLAEDNPGHDYFTRFDVEGDMHVGVTSECEIDGYLHQDPDAQHPAVEVVH